MEDMMSLAFLKKMKEKGMMDAEECCDEEGLEMEISGEEPEDDEKSKTWAMNDESKGKVALGSYQSGKAGMDMMSEDSIMRVLKMRDKDQHG